jgi:hypothetical protein
MITTKCIKFKGKTKLCPVRDLQMILMNKIQYRKGKGGRSGSYSFSLSAFMIYGNYALPTLDGTQP